MKFLTRHRGGDLTAFILGLFVVCAVFFGLFLYYRSGHVLSYVELNARFVPGVHGVILRIPESQHRPSFEPWHPLEQNRSLEAMLNRLCLEAQAAESCAKEPGVLFEMYTKQHRVGNSSEYTVLERGTQFISEPITALLLTERLGLIREWALKNQRANGSLPYLYHPSSGAYPEGSNVIREMITVQGLYELAQSMHDDALKSAALKAERYVMQRSYRIDTSGTFAYMVEEGGDVKLGASALAVLALRAPKDVIETLSREEYLLGEFLLRMQREDGSFQTFLHDEVGNENDRFYSGEALTALATLSLSSNDVRYIEALGRSFPYYQSLIVGDFYPQYAPWHMQAYTIAYQQTRDERYADFVYMLADRLIETMLEEDAVARADELGRFFNPTHSEWGPPHSSSTGIYTEGLTYAYELARLKGDSVRMARYREAIFAGSRSLLHTQWTTASAYYLEYPERVIGAFKRTITDNRHRLDQVGHAVNALVRVQTLILE